MIKPIHIDHFMYDFASTWCILEYDIEMSFVDFIGMMHHIKSVCGDNYQELHVDIDPISGMDWYWGWLDGEHYKFACYFTTDEQATYYALANTLPFPETAEEQKERFRKMAASMHQNTGSGGIGGSIKLTGGRGSSGSWSGARTGTPISVGQAVGRAWRDPKLDDGQKSAFDILDQIRDRKEQVRKKEEDGDKSS